MSCRPAAFLGGLRAKESEFADGPVELTSVCATDDEEFGSVSGMSPPIRVVGFGTDFEPNANSQGETPIASRPIL
ncbi:hypothetical protein HDF14_001615 [Edaphobacter lichenicola]|jgi:hypothetical protein|uniref:Uncharacterized protein n=1 Tax=Tunturiibacter gelidiferens TaxID=3069689 RepID=A0A9X0QD32_9BACT|nr:hypothetical protein [Edaphobacter lichenicola]